jgi:hypothetical protein
MTIQEYRNVLLFLLSFEFLFLIALSLFGVPVDALPLALVDSRQPRSVVCGSISWQNILVFYLLNYATHAMTIKSVPSEQLFDTSSRILWALLLPFSGVLAGCEAISVWKHKYEDELQ